MLYLITIDIKLQQIFQKTNLLPNKWMAAKQN